MAGEDRVGNVYPKLNLLYPFVSFMKMDRIGIYVPTNFWLNQNQEVLTESPRLFTGWINIRVKFMAMFTKLF